MTSVPARIWGIADRYGTLEPGKDADVVIWDGDPLEVTSFADAVFIRGKADAHDQPADSSCATATRTSRRRCRRFIASRRFPGPRRRGPDLP